MIRFQRPIVALGAALLLAPLLGAQPAYADGAASTRNIIFGAAAAAAGTLLIINHNKKVHEHYAEDARKQAALQEQNNNVQAAYESERRAYDNEVALVQSYQHETAVQHGEVVRQRDEIASLKHQLTVASAPSHAAPSHVATSGTPRIAAAQPAKAQDVVVSYGWGDL
jgi:hypothetical protein